jgi:DNA-binding response OmpR family regulator
MTKNILLVDDNQLVLYGLAKALKSSSYTVQTASTAQTAFKKLSFCPYDLCMLDINLPDINGMELMKVIKEFCPKTKIIIMTASNLESPVLSDNINSAINNGACHFIAKPFNLCEVTEVIQQVLDDTADDFHTGFRFTGSDFIRKARKSPRKPFEEENIFFQMSVIDEGHSIRRSMEAKVLDISETGIGLLTRYPIKESQVIGFDEKVDNKTGVVAWSKMIDEENCRVGIRFG